MTLYRRIKDYCDRRKAHYHLERIAFPSEEPTEEDLRGEDAEVIRMNMQYDEENRLGIGALTKEDIRRLEGKV